MSDIRRFGEQVEGFKVPVLNEREIRAAAGILFLATFLSLLYILFRGNFLPIKFVIPVSSRTSWCAWASAPASRPP